MTISKEFLQVLLKVQSELPVVGKTTQAYNYKYAPIDHVWDSVKDVLQKNGFVITNAITSEGVRTSAFHELGESSSFIPFSSPTLEPQKRGSEITYARRYNLTAIFNIIVAGEDDDAQATKPAVADPTDAWAPDTEYTPQAPKEVVMCPEHNVEYRKFEKNGREWYSHKIEGTDGWCNKK